MYECKKHIATALIFSLFIFFTIDKKSFLFDKKWNNVFLWGKEVDDFHTLDKNQIKIPQIGNVVINDDVWIGANCCIDRSTFESTIIGKGTKMDNLIQIGHNVIIGKNCLISGSTAIGGSTVIGDNVTIAAKSGVTKNIVNNKVVAGFPAKDINLWKKEIIRNNLKK